MTKYLISTDGHLSSTLRNRDNKIIFIENISEVHKAVEIWVEDLQVEVDFDSIETNLTLQTVMFMWDSDYNGEEYYYMAQWTLIEIDKP